MCRCLAHLAHLAQLTGLHGGHSGLPNEFFYFYDGCSHRFARFPKSEQRRRDRASGLQIHSIRPSAASLIGLHDGGHRRANSLPAVIKLSTLAVVDLAFFAAVFDIVSLGGLQQHQQDKRDQLKLQGPKL